MPDQPRGHDRVYAGSVLVHAREHARAVALCGIEPGLGSMVPIEGGSYVRDVRGDRR